MNVTRIINKSGFSLEKKMSVKLQCSTNANLKAMIENDEELNDDTIKFCRLFAVEDYAVSNTVVVDHHQVLHHFQS